jgi:hypothetical protein
MYFECVDYGQSVGIDGDIIRLLKMEDTEIAFLNGLV